MLSFLAGRVLQSLMLMLGVLGLVFFMVRLTGDPAALMLPKEASLQQRLEFRQSLGLDQPLPVQFAVYLGQVLRGDLGQSLRLAQPNADLVLERLPATLELAFGAFALAVIVAVPLGLIAGSQPASLIDIGARGLAFSAQVLPSFWLAMLLILVFAVGLAWLPSFGRDSLASLVLPAVALGFAGLGQLLRLTRAAVLETRSADYVRTARSKGLTEHQIGWKHILRNALLPLISVAGVQFTYLLGGSVYIESVFAWPGLGSLLETAIRDSDFPLVQAITLFISVTAIGVQLLGDVLSALVDPSGQGIVTRAVSAAHSRNNWHNLSAWAGGVLLVSLVLIAVFAPLIAPHAPSDGDLGNAKLPPAWLAGGNPSFLFGTDGLGQDVLSRIIYGTRVSIIVGVCGVGLAVLIGASLGLLAGYYGGAVDAFVSSVGNLILSIPYLVLVIVLATVLGRNLLNVILLFGVTDAPVFIRLVRSEAQRLKTLPFVEAAKALGSSDLRIIALHIAPNLLGSLVTLATFEASAMIFYEAGLGFLGLSVPPQIPSWGNMLALGRQTLTVYPWMSVFPGLAIALSALAINLLGEWLRFHLDPRKA